MAYGVGPIHVAFPDPLRAKRCVDVLEWRGELTLGGDPAGRVWLFEIDHPRLRLRGKALGEVFSECLGGAYREILDASARARWQGRSPLLVFESIRLFPCARGQGHGLEIVRATVERFAERGVGAVVLKAMPLQYVDGASTKWVAEMGATIGTHPWFPADILSPNPEAFEKVEAYWRRLGWREIEDHRGRKRTFLLELAE